MADPCREYLAEFGDIETAFMEMGVSYMKMRRELSDTERHVSRGYVRRSVLRPRKPPKAAPPAIDDDLVATGKSDD